MALDSKNNIKSVFVVPDQSAVAAGTKMFPGATATGSVTVCDVTNVVLDATTVLDQSTIKIIKDRGANLPLQQVRLNLADLTAYTGAAYTPASEQISYIGYNGSNTSTLTSYTGNLDSVFYVVKLEHVPNAFAYGKRPANYKYGTWQAPASGTIATKLAENLVKSLVQNFKPNRTIDWRVKSEVIINSSGSSIGGLTGLTLTKYSKQATFTGATPTVGQVVRIGEIGSGTVGTTDPVFVVTAVNGQVATFNYAYQGESGTAVAAEVNQITTGWLNAGTLAGIKITGIKQKYDVNRWRQYDKVRFNALLENFGTDTPVTTDAATDGLGVYEQVANDEYISWGDEGQIFVDQVPPQFREQDAVVGGEYSPLVLGWVNHLPSLIGAGENKGQAILYMENATASLQALEIVDVLDAWALLKGFPIQVGNL